MVFTYVEIMRLAYRFTVDRRGLPPRDDKMVS